jgi:hypothetical protein
MPTITINMVKQFGCKVINKITMKKCIKCADTNCSLKIHHKNIFGNKYICLYCFNALRLSKRKKQIRLILKGTTMEPPTHVLACDVDSTNTLMSFINYN